MMIEIPWRTGLRSDYLNNVLQLKMETSNVALKKLCVVVGLH